MIYRSRAGGIQVSGFMDSRLRGNDGLISGSLTKKHLIPVASVTILTLFGILSG
jgi:hypothetical protein